MAIAYLGIGTNLGNKRQEIEEAIQYIQKQIGKIVSQSAFHSYAPWGFHSANSFLNAVIAVNTTLSPREVLIETQSIEKSMGRTEKSVDKHYQDRLIDIDILLYDDLCMNEKDLTIPHPLMTERLFVMEPLAEIAPDFVHPTYHKSIKELLITLQS
jgi:2-amino-4-hydroxy-6-hydroxymethyldihydropteridine diphosphokinase